LTICTVISFHYNIQKKIHARQIRYKLCADIIKYQDTWEIYYISENLRKTNLFALVASLASLCQEARPCIPISRDGSEMQFSGCFLFSGMNSARGDRIAYSVSVAKTRRIHSEGEFSDPPKEDRIFRFPYGEARNISFRFIEEFVHWK